MDQSPATPLLLTRALRSRRPSSNDHSESEDDGETSNSEQVSLKRKRESSPPEQQISDPIIATNCPICLEPCENTGQHRIASLSCGHLFGEKCVQRWLSAARNCCPTCQSECDVDDIRTIYASHVIVQDRSNERRLFAKIRVLRQRVANLEQQLEDR